MARNFNKRNQGKSVKWEFKGFHTVDLSSKEQFSANEWLDGRSVDFGGIIADMCIDRWKIGFGHDPGRDAFSCSITDKGIGTPYSGHCFMLYHSDLEKLVKIGMWFYSVMLKNGDYNPEDASGSYDW